MLELKTVLRVLYPEIVVLLKFFFLNIFSFTFLDVTRKLVPTLNTIIKEGTRFTCFIRGTIKYYYRINLSIYLSDPPYSSSGGLLNNISFVSPTGFRTFHFVSFLYGFFFSFRFLLFRFFSHCFLFVFFFCISFFFCVSFRYFSHCCLFGFFLFVSFRFFFFFRFLRFSVYRYPIFCDKKVSGRRMVCVIKTWYSVFNIAQYLRLTFPLNTVLYIAIV